METLFKKFTKGPRPKDVRIAEVLQEPESFSRVINLAKIFATNFILLYR